MQATIESIFRPARRPWALWVLLLGLGLASVSPAQEPDGGAPGLLALLDRFLAAVDDPAMHDRFWDESLVYTSSSGARFGKAEILQGISDEATSTAPAVRYRAENAQVMNFGDVAVVVFRLVSETVGPEPQAVEIQEFYNTGTFRRIDDEWRAVAWQATRIPAPD
jgi:ketosteroid isomerase-like protein